MERLENTERVPVDQHCTKNENEITRRSFAKEMAAFSLLSCLAAVSAPRRAFAWLDGGFPERDDLADALKVIAKTYGHIEPYPRKFNDAIAKTYLRNLDFAIGKGLEEELAEHEARVLGALIERHINPAIKRTGRKDMFLWGIFERTACSYQLYEYIDVKDGERSFPCPFKGMLEQPQKRMGTYKISWSDVCAKSCMLRWKAFAKKAGGVEFTVEPGDICKVKLL